MRAKVISRTSIIDTWSQAWLHDWYEARYTRCEVHSVLISLNLLLLEMTTVTVRDAKREDMKEVVRLIQVRPVLAEDKSVSISDRKIIIFISLKKERSSFKGTITIHWHYPFWFIVANCEIVDQPVASKLLFLVFQKRSKLWLLNFGLTIIIHQLIQGELITSCSVCVV